MEVGKELATKVYRKVGTEVDIEVDTGLAMEVGEKGRHGDRNGGRHEWK